MADRLCFSFYWPNYGREGQLFRIEPGEPAYPRCYLDILYTKHGEWLVSLFLEALYLCCVWPLRPRIRRSTIQA